MKIVGQKWLNLVTWTYGSWSEGQYDLYFMVQWFSLISWRLFDVCTSYFGCMNQYDPTFDLKTNVGSLWPIFHGPVIWPYILKVIWCMNILIWDYESVWPDVWPQNKSRSLWPIFHGPVILRYILKTVWCMNMILWDFGSVWPDAWPQNKCRCMWPVFHGPVILSYISNTIWCMSAIFSYNETVWAKLWSLSKCESTWPIFHGLVILLSIFKIICWMNIIVGIMDQCYT